MTVLRIDASIQGDRSASSALADKAIQALLAVRPDERIVERHLGQHPLPVDAWQNAVAGSFVPEDDRSPAQRDALALADQLATELEQADGIVLAFPLYNFGVSQHVKVWIDIAIAGRPNGTRLLEGKPVVLLTTRGGSYGPGTPREGWDHNTDFLRRILADLWGADLTTIEREFTLVGVNPALDQFAEAASLMHKTAEEAAADAGSALAGRRAA